MALAQYHGRGLESDGLSVAQGGEGQTPKEDQRDRRHLRQHKKKDDQAVSSGSVKRLSIDCKATVKIGEYSRGGLTRGDNQASDHDMGCQEKYVPCGIVDEESAELTITFGSSYKTSDFIVDVLEAKWDALDEQEKVATNLIDAETMLEWAKRMTWKGMHPVVELSRKIYQKGIALGKVAMQAVEERLERHPALPKYDILINPAPTS